jgi:hypothetical protein
LQLVLVQKVLRGLAALVFRQLALPSLMLISCNLTAYELIALQSVAYFQCSAWYVQAQLSLSGLSVRHPQLPILDLSPQLYTRLLGARRAALPSVSFHTA